jgi:hypothetical protein
MVVNCDTTTNTGEKFLCACKIAAETYEKFYQIYEKNVANFTSESASYNRWKTKHDTWKNKTGDYSIWNDIVTSIDYTFNKELQWDKFAQNWDGFINHPDFNYQCGSHAEKDGKYDPWGFYAYEIYGDGGGGRVSARCKRTEGSKTKIQNDYKAPEPTSDDEKSWVNTDKPINNFTSPEYNSVCCAQIFTDIQSDGAISFENVSQKCGITSATPSANQNTMYIIIAIIIVMISVSVSVAAMMMM